MEKRTFVPAVLCCLALISGKCLYHRSSSHSQQHCLQPACEMDQVPTITALTLCCAVVPGCAAQAPTPGIAAPAPIPGGPGGC